MRKIFLNLLFASLLVATTFNGCKKADKINLQSQPPIANAGADQYILLPRDSAQLTGADSRSVGTIVNFEWTKISGPASFNIDNPHAEKTIVKRLVIGLYLFELKITNDKGLDAKDTVQVKVTDPKGNSNPPIANAGTDQIITLPINSVTLDGSGSTDADNNITEYLWTKISGPTMGQITPVNTMKLQLSNMLKGFHYYELKVTDAYGSFSKDTVKVTVNEPPYEVCDNSSRTHVNARLIPFGMLSEPRGGMVIASAGNKILFAGAALSGSPADYGSTRVDIYDMNTQIWSTASLSEKRSHMAVIAAGNKIFFAGGRLGDGAWDNLYATVDIYDVSTNKWSVASLSEPRAFVSAAAVGNRVFFAGGEKDMNYQTSNTVDIFDLSTNGWTVTHLSEARANISAVTVNNKIYFAGGTSEDRWGTPSNRIDIYDDLNNTWSTSSLSEPMGSITGINVADKIYWTGKCTVEIRDVTTGNISFEQLFKPGYWMPDAGSNAVVKDNKIVFLRHSWNNLNTNNKFDIYDISTKTWSIGVLPMVLDIASIFSLNNTIYLAGGYRNGQVSKEIFTLEF